MFLFPELILQRPSRPRARHSDPLPSPRGAVTRQCFPVLPSPSEHLQPSPFRLEAQPPSTTSAASPFEPVGNASPRLLLVSQVPSSVPQDFPPQSHPRNLASDVYTATPPVVVADAVQTIAPVGPPRDEALYIPAANLLPPEPSQAGFFRATNQLPAAQTKEACTGAINSQRNGKPNPRGPKPLYVARAGARRASLQAGVSGRGAAVLSASEANVLNSGSAGPPAVSDEGGWRTAARELGGSAGTANAKVSKGNQLAN